MLKVNPSTWLDEPASFPYEIVSELIPTHLVHGLTQLATAGHPLRLGHHRPCPPTRSAAGMLLVEERRARRFLGFRGFFGPRCASQDMWIPMGSSIDKAKKGLQ